MNKQAFPILYNYIIYNVYACILECMCVSNACMHIWLSYDQGISKGSDCMKDNNNNNNKFLQKKQQKCGTRIKCTWYSNCILYLNFSSRST